MKRDHINYFAVGLFVLLMLALLIFALLKISGDSQKNDVYFTYLKNVSGIKRGAPVTYQGFELGHVEKIEPAQKDGQNYYRLVLAVKHGWKIPSDSQAMISASGLLSGMLVDIREGKKETVLPPGSEISGLDVANLFQSMTALSENLNQRVARIGDKVEESLPEIQALLRKLNQSATLLEATLSGENQAHLASLLKNANASSTHFLRLSTDLHETRKRLDQMLEETHATIKTSRPELEASATELHQALQRVGTILHHLEGTSLNTRELTRELRLNPSLLLQSKPPADAATAEENR
ncbi:MAG: mce related protein [Betaproteobacteria bacterium ADurb.Bin341]|nr:MAG: mce related protein [Betaproteobacteria bacterium ADurb.Bin341]